MGEMKIKHSTQVRISDLEAFQIQIDRKYHRVKQISSYSELQYAKSFLALSPLPTLEATRKEM